MRRWGWAALVAVACWVGCGEGGSLPKDSQEQTGGTNPDGTVDVPDIPEEPAQDKDPATPPPPVPPPGLWPLTAGSTWTYRITDEGKEPSVKRVEVLGEQPVPGTTMTAIAVRSEQPHLVELSWQVEKDGVAFRLREEDRKPGLATPLRVMTWNPATVKALSRERPVGWSFRSAIEERTRFGDGTEEVKTKTYLWRVEAVNETVTTPAGTFTNAIRLKREREREGQENSERTYWLVPGIGKVKEEGERTEELLSFDVKKP